MRPPLRQGSRLPYLLRMVTPEPKPSTCVKEVGDMSAWSPKQTSVPLLMRWHPRHTVGQRRMPSRHPAASRGWRHSPRYRLLPSNPMAAFRSLALGDPLRTVPDSPWPLHSSISDLGPPRCVPTMWFDVAAPGSRCLSLPKVDFWGQSSSPFSPYTLTGRFLKCPLTTLHTLLHFDRNPATRTPRPLSSPRTSAPSVFPCHVLTCNPT